MEDNNNEDDEKIKIFSSEDEQLKFLGEILSNESSRKILLLLTNNEMTANEIAEKTNIRLSLVMYHINKMIQVDIIQINKIKKNSKNHDLKYYSAKLGIMIFPHEIAQRAKGSKTLSTVLKRISKLSVISFIGVLSWFLTRYMQIQQNTKNDSITQFPNELADPVIPNESIDWFLINNEMWIPIVTTVSVIIISYIWIRRK